MKRLVIMALSLLVLTGCPREKRAMEVSRKAVEVTAQLVQVVDQQVAGDYALAAAAALEACDTSTCYAGKMNKWNKAIQAVASMKTSLLIVEGSLDAWAAGSPNGAQNMRDAAACFLSTLGQLQRLLSDVGARTSTLAHVLAVGQSLFGLTSDACPAGAIS